MKSSDLVILKIFLVRPDILRQAEDIALITGTHRRTVYRSLNKLVELGLVTKHIHQYFLNPAVIGSLYGKKTELKKNLKTEYFKMDSPWPMELELAKHFISDPHGFWTVSELSMLLSRAVNTIQYNLDALAWFNIIFRDNTEFSKNRANPVYYKLTPELALNLTAEKQRLLNNQKEIEYAK